MLECKDVRPLLADYEAGNLPDEQAGQVADHLLLCPICAAALEELRREKDRPAAVPSPAAPRSLGTQDPLTEQKAAAAAPEQAPAPVEETAEQESVIAQTTEIGPRRKLRRRTKVFIGLAVLLVLVGVCAGILYSRGLFDIQDWAKSEDGRLVAVAYEDTASGEDGFRIRLWDTKEKQWHDELAFWDGVFRQMRWSPDGVYLAVEYRDFGDKNRVIVLAMLEDGIQTIRLQTVLDIRMEQNDGYLGKIPLLGTPECQILGWLSDGSALLVAAEGVVDTNIDPDYGIELAGSGSTPIQPREGADNAQVVTGCLSFSANNWELNVISGFGIPAESEILSRQNRLKSRFSNYMSLLGTSFTEKTLEVFFDAEALLQLHRVTRDGVPLHLYYYMGDEFTARETFIRIEGGLSALADLASEEGVMLLRGKRQFVQNYVEEAYLIIPYPHGSIVQ